MHPPRQAVRIREPFERFRATWLMAALVVAQFGVTVVAAEWKLDVTFPESARAQPYTGRVYVLFSRRNREPRKGPDWFNPEQFVARDVVDLKPGEAVVFDSSRPDELLSYPDDPATLKLSGTWAQAVIRFNPHEREIGTGPGNGFSDAVQIPSANSESLQHSFSVEHIVPESEYQDTKWSRLLEVKSQRLSRFHGRDVSLRASVLVPRSYFDQPERRYPVILTVPGFGGDHRRGRPAAPVEERNEGGVEFIRVLLDPSCPLGHHVFADSANNGPVGAAFTEEFIPELDRRYRTIPKSTARFLTGHSSGGWSTLWLQVTYPEVFGGTWSTAPDPVDFRDFQRINLYRPGENMYVDGKGNRRPLARVRGQVLLWYDGFSHMEHVLGYGGQLHSFEAVFSPRDENGQPRLVWDRETGVVDTEVAKTWEKYDIRLVLERNRDTLGPKLRGKLHVIMGDKDTFYLEGATILLKESLKEHYPDAVVEIHPGRDHMNLMTRELVTRIRREMVQQFLKHHPAPEQGAN